jgi:hypothetical protein
MQSVSCILIASYRPTRLELQTKDGEEWDLNIRRGLGGDSDKKLEQWIHRQRCLYDSGKIQKGRQKELEDIGLRWSVRVRLTSQWDAMYEILCQYVKERKAVEPTNSWDGNVPAKYKTKDNPPKSLGQWVTTQRSAYGKGKLKKERLDQLNAIGLRWSAH